MSELRKWQIVGMVNKDNQDFEEGFDVSSFIHALGEKDFMEAMESRLAKELFKKQGLEVEVQDA